MINYKVIDLNNYKHKAHLDYFMGMQYPQVNVTSNVDVTDLKSYCKREGISFFLTFLHIVAISADAIPQFRQRIHRLSPDSDDFEIREYEQSPTSHTEATSDELYCYCPLFHHVPWAEYIDTATKEQQIARTTGTLEEHTEIEAFYFASSVPWLNYSSVVHPMENKFASNPIFSWGKFEEDFRGRLMMPMTVIVHHGLVDGKQIGMFYDNLSKNMALLLSKGELE